MNDTIALAYFEYRIDGKQVGTEQHPVMNGDVTYPVACGNLQAREMCPSGRFERPLGESVGGSSPAVCESSRSR